MIAAGSAYCILTCNGVSLVASSAWSHPTYIPHEVGLRAVASSSRTSGAAGRLSVVPASSVWRRLRSMAAVRGRYCTSALYLAENLL